MDAVQTTTAPAMAGKKKRRPLRFRDATGKPPAGPTTTGERNV